MRVVITLKCKESLLEFPPAIQKKLAKQINYLLSDLRHPSLRTKKYNESRGIWQARVDRSIRFYFLIKKDQYVLLDITYHPK